MVDVEVEVLEMRLDGVWPMVQDLSWLGGWRGGGEFGLH